MRLNRFALLFLPACLFTVFCSAFFTACTNQPKAKAENTSEALLEEKNIVKTTILEKTDFLQEIVSNGKLSATQRAELYFKNSGLIETIDVKNGQSIAKGSRIAKLQSSDYEFDLKTAELSLEEAKIDKIDVLLSMGYSGSDKKYNSDHEKIADIRSGYNQALVAFEEAKLKLTETVLTAPFEGKIAGITQKPFEKADVSAPFCILINDSRFYIDFPLLETEISKVKLNQKVTISPVSGAKETAGVICEINPLIDENGLIWLKAEVANPGTYMEGMNVKVSIKQAISEQLVVPKQAVVLRQNREVLFRYTRGTAYWTYINVLNENEKEYAVTAAEGATLEPGDTIIISNNLNLAHESEVEMEE